MPSVLRQLASRRLSDNIFLFQGTSFVYVNPLLSLSEATTAMAPLTAWNGAQNGSSSVETMPSWQDFNVIYLIPYQVVRCTALRLSRVPDRRLHFRSQSAAATSSAQA